MSVDLTALSSPDTQVPLEECLDGAGMLQTFRRELVDVPQRVRDAWRRCERIETLYHPGRHICVAYAVWNADQSTARRSWPEAQLVYVHAPARPTMSRRGTRIPCGAYAAEAYPFPNDRRLRGLRKFARRDRCAETWQAWARANNDHSVLVPETLQRLLLRYVPEQKWIARLRAEFRNQGSHETEKRRIAIRASSIRSTRALWERHTELAAVAFGGGPVFTVPAVVGACMERGLLAVQWLRGDNLIQAIRSHGIAELARNVAERLSRLHATPLPRLPRLNAARLAARVEGITADLATAYPPCGEDVRAIGANLLTTLARLRSLRPCTIHNDFHWKQLTFKRGTFGLLDLERMALGDPHLDVAAFFSQLQMLGYRPDLAVTHEEAAAWSSAFLSAWLQVTRADFERERFECYAALARLELARGQMKHLRPGWRELLERCVSLARVDLAGANPGRWCHDV